MYKVLIGLLEEAKAESLAEACRIFISKVKNIVKDGGCSLQVLLESCMITTEIDGTTCMMNFYFIRDFSHGIGILREDGSLSEKPLPYIPKDFERQIFVAAHNSSYEAFMAENGERISELMASHSDEPAEKSLIIT
jgi:hypothetical protein